MRQFRAALADPATAQAATLERITGLVAGSPYARRVGLTAGMSYEQFACRVPLCDYEDLRPWVDRDVATGEPQLSRRPTVVFERTSGSSGRTKLVPYSAALLASFNACFVLWAHDLLAHGPKLTTARTFCGVSPALELGGRTPHGIPISLADDAAYLAPRYQRLLQRLLVASPSLKSITDGDEYRRALAAVLIAERRLEIISVWSPTYLLALLDTIVSLRGPTDWTQLWPELTLISCWTDAGSRAFVPALRRAFPRVRIQGKGLLATEAPITVPLSSAPAPVPLLDEVFLEFEDEDGEVRRLHQLVDGAEYGVVVTQAGGLLRYRMGDRVRVAGRVERTPCLEFLGRHGGSDLTGEKLDERQAHAALSAELGTEGHCSYLMAVLPAGYVCVTDHPQAATDACGLARRLETQLAQSFQYRQARHLGQLAPLSVAHRADARAAYEAAQLARGLRWGNIKFAALLPAPRP